MCYNCGCGRPDDDMNLPNTITTAKVNKAAEEMHQTKKQTLEHIIATAQSELAKEKDQA